MAAPSVNPLPNRPLTPVGAILSYLVPGLGQIAQGRILKGVVFLISIYTLFFYGLYLGAGHYKLGQGPNAIEYHVSGNVYLPDTSDDNNLDKNSSPLQRLLWNLWNRPQFAGQFWVGIAAWPAIWQYVYFDRTKESDPIFGDYMREPTVDALNAIHNAGDKQLELAWVYTVIAGVLNIMIIYDALAGPAHQDNPATKKTT